MSLIERALYRLVNGEKKINSPIFIKDFDENSIHIQEMEALVDQIPSDKEESYQRELAFFKAGLVGEKNVHFELKNSFVPMLVLHDIRLQFEDLVAQCDFILLTRSGIFVLETKKLTGNIEITKDGDFIRTIPFYKGKGYRKEGMYSPIAQNERHITILRNILQKEKLIGKSMPFYSAVILANPKTIVKKKWASKEVANQIYRYDQITSFLKSKMAESPKDILEKQLFDIADYLVTQNTPLFVNLKAKYGIEDESSKQLATAEIDLAIHQISASTMERQPKDLIEELVQTVNCDVLETELKRYRLEQSRKEEIKPYFIFTNAEMSDLIEKIPRTKHELLKVKGFGVKKVEKYGEAIIEIVNRRS